MPVIINNPNGMNLPLGMNDPFAPNPNINFLLNPQITISPPNMVPAGSLNIPRFDEFDERRKEERYHIRNPTYVPSKYEPLKMDLPKYEPPPLLPIIKLDTDFKPKHKKLPWETDW